MSRCKPASRTSDGSPSRALGTRAVRRPAPSARSRPANPPIRKEDRYKRIPPAYQTKDASWRLWSEPTLSAWDLSDQEVAGEIDTMNADGSGVAPLTHGGPGFAQPSWSPDGKSIAFVAYPSSSAPGYSARSAMWPTPT